MFFRWFLSGSLLFVSIFCWSCSTTSSRSNSRSKPAQEAFSSKQRKLPQRLAIRYLERSMGRFVLARAVQPKVPKSTSPFPLRARENWVRLLREIRPLVGSLPAYRLKLLQRKLRREKERDRLHYSVFPEHLERDIEALYTNSQRQILASKEAALLAYRRALRAQSSAEKAMEKALLDSLHHHHAPSHSHRHKVRRARRRYRSRRSKQTRRFYRSLRLLFPVPGYRIGSGYGWRSDPFTRRRRFHGAVDIGAPRGTPILAVASGTVTGARWMGSCGRAVLIRHRNLRYRRVYSGYCHMYRIKVRRGQRVRRGQLIGLVGSTGRSTAPHLHFFLRIHRRTVNPANHFR